MKKLICVILSLVMIIGSSCVASAADMSFSAGGYEILIDGEAREIGDGVLLFNDYGLSMTYLIIGSESCLLIDTGTGFEDFRQRIEKYTDGKPLAVALTHGHVDHAGGSEQFEQVYLNDADNSVLWQRSLLVRKFFSSCAGGILKPFTGMPDISNKSNVEQSETLSLEDGHVFDLGDREVTFYLTPGHTPGSGCFYDSKTDYLITGDITGHNVLMFFAESTDLTTYNASLKRIAELEKTAKKIYAGHSLAPIESAVTDELIVMTQELIEREENCFGLKLPYLKSGKAQLSDGTTQSITIIGWLNK